jgi:MFS transporter, DHA1 family, inner membrane transport protein
LTQDDQSQFARWEVISVVMTGVAGGAIAALQPLLLGGLMAAGRIDSPQIGQAAMLESLGMAISATIAAAVLKPQRLRLIIAAAAVGAMGANLLTPMTQGAGVILARGMSGLCSGLMLWLVVGLLTRASLPARLLAIYITVQASVAFLLASAFAAFLIPRFGSVGSYTALAVIDVIVLVLCTCLPRSYRPIPDVPAGGLPPFWGLLGLAGIMLYFAGILGFWVYVEPLVVELGHSAVLARTAVSMGVGIQIVAGILATVLARRLNATPTIIVSATASIFSIVLLVETQATLSLFAGIITFSFFWMFVPAFQMPFLLEIDPTRRSAMHIATAQLFGAAGGPILASSAVSIIGLKAVAATAIALFSSGAICMTIAHKQSRG